MIYGYARISTAAQDETGQVRQLKAAGCEKVFREKITGTTADRPQLAALMKKLAPGDVVITPAVDRLSRDTTDLLDIARDMQRAGAGIRSLTEPFLDTHPTSPRSSSPSLALRRSSNADAFSSAPRAAEPTRKRTASNSAASRSSHRTSKGSPQAPRRGRDAAQCRPQLQRQPKHDLAVANMTVCIAALSANGGRIVCLADKALSYLDVMGRAGVTRHEAANQWRVALRSTRPTPAAMRLATGHRTVEKTQHIDSKFFKVVGI